MLCGVAIGIACALVEVIKTALSQGALLHSARLRNGRVAMSVQKARNGAVWCEVVALTCPVSIIKQRRKHKKNGGLNCLRNGLFRPSVIGPLEIVDHDLFSLLHLHLKIRILIIVVDPKMLLGLFLSDQRHLRLPFLERQRAPARSVWPPS